MNKEICKLLLQLRNLRGITQQELADLVGYSRRQIARIEAGEIEISKEAASILSKFYKIDINHYMNINSSFESLSSYNEFVSLHNLVEKRDLNAIKESTIRLSDNPEFQSGEKLQLILYCKALIFSLLEKRYIESNKLAFSGLSEFGYNNYITALKNEILNETSYPLLFIIGYNYTKAHEYTLARELNIELYNHFENNIFNNTIPLKSDMYDMKKYYITSINNLANMYFLSEEYDKSLELVNKGIDKSAEFNISAILYALLQLKFEVYYMLNDFENAKKYFNIFESICETTGFIEYFNDVYEELKSKYYLLFAN